MRFGNPIIPTEEMRRVLQLCVEWYDGNPCGGELHVVLDDDNVDDSLIEGEVARLKKNTHALNILNELKKLSEMQRKWVTYNIYNVMAGDGEREILEEFEDEFD